jgi:ATP-dependent DNA ligase
MRKSSATKISFIEPMYAMGVRGLARRAGAALRDQAGRLSVYRGRDSSGVSLWSRRGNILTPQFPMIADACKKLPPDTRIDGEIVALDENGRISFNLLQHHRSRASAILYYVFDLLVYRGRSLIKVPLSERRAALASLPLPAVPSFLTLSETTMPLCRS